MFDSPFNGFQVIQTFPSDPHYPTEPGFVIYDRVRRIIYVRDDEYERLVENINNNVTRSIQ